MLHLQILACSMPQLKTLNITTIPWPIGYLVNGQHPRTTLHLIPTTAHAQLISMLANDIFSARRAWVKKSHGKEPRASLDLQVLAFGINDKGRPWERTGRSVRVIYWAPTQVLSTARTFTEMRRTTLLELRKHQQETDILETNFQMYKQRYDNRYWISEEEPSEDEDEEDGLGVDSDDDDDNDDDNDDHENEEDDDDFSDASDSGNHVTVDSAAEYYNFDTEETTYDSRPAPAVMVPNWPDTTPHPHTHW